MKKFLIIAIAAVLLVSCGSPADNYISKLKDGTEKLKKAKSSEEVTKITGEITKYYFDNKEAIDKAVAEDTKVSQAVTEASTAYIQASADATQASIESAVGGMGE